MSSLAYDTKKLKKKKKEKKAEFLQGHSELII